MARIWLKLVLAMLLFSSIGGVFTIQKAAAATSCECVIYILNRFNNGVGFPNPDGRYNHAYQLDRPDPDGRIWMERIANGSFRRTSEPRPGGVVVIQRGVAGANTTSGHIGVIENVSSQGNNWVITLRSSNWWGGTFTDANCNNVSSVPLTVSKNESGVSYWAQGNPPVVPTVNPGQPTTVPPATTTPQPPQPCPSIGLLSPRAGQTFNRRTITFTWQLPSGDCAGSPIVLRVKRTPGMSDPGNGVLNVVLSRGTTSHTVTFAPEVDGIPLYWAVWYERSGTGASAVESFRIVPDPLPQGNACSAPLLRYYHDQKQRHFYTRHAEELGQGRNGWAYEGFEGYVATSPGCASGLVPFTRLYHPSRNKHFYTASPAEVELARQLGFVVEGVIGYILPNPGPTAGVQPLYRLFKKPSDNHFYTVKQGEVDLAVNRFGYTSEGVAGYVFNSLIVAPTATPVPPTATPVQPTATPVSPTATPIQPTATSVPGSTDNLWASMGALLVEPRQPSVGSSTLLSLRIERSGGKAPLSNVCARFYVGNPANGGQVIGDGCIPVLAPRSAAATSTVSWIPSSPGTTTIYAVIDPEGTIHEGSKTDNVISTTVTVDPLRQDNLAPRVDHAEIVGGPETFNRTVHILADASDPSPGSGVAEMLLVAYRYSTEGKSWIPDRVSAWLPYQGISGQYTLEIGGTPGMHYIQVWARDGAGNVSIQPYQLLVNYQANTDRLESGDVRIYRYEMRAGEQLSVRVLPVGDSDPDLYIWPPDYEQGRPPWVSNLSEGVDRISLTAPVSGIYQVEVVGYIGGEYALLVEQGASLLALAEETQEQGESRDALKLLRTEPALPLTSLPIIDTLPQFTVYLPVLRN